MYTRGEKEWKNGYLQAGLLLTVNAVLRPLSPLTVKSRGQKPNMSSLDAYTTTSLSIQTDDVSSGRCLEHVDSGQYNVDVWTQ